MRHFITPLCGILAACLTGCSIMSNSTQGTITHADFGKTKAGQTVEIYTLRNGHGLEARILTYGGIVQSLSVPDRKGRFADVVLGFDNLSGYLTNPPYFGALIGRYGNRIGGAKFTLAGQTYQLAANNGPNSLHGGLKGFDKVVWAARAQSTTAGPSLILNYVSPDGEEGFPGKLEVTATYTLTDKNELNLEFTAHTDKTTVVNLTHHSYFNLAGQGNGDILGHLMQINARQITPVDSTLIPTGEFADVTGTPFDFRQPTAIGARINAPDQVLEYCRGYDQNWVINKPLGQLGLQARVVESVSGRVLEVWSDEPGVQFYAGNFLSDTLVGKGGTRYHRRTGFCLEPQHYPDSPNKPQFPTVELRPGQIFQSTISYRFGVD